MKRISQERVWEEMKKAWPQAKDYNYYLDFYKSCSVYYKLIKIN